MSAPQYDAFLEDLRATAAKAQAQQAENAQAWATLLALFEQVEARKRLERGDDGFEPCRVP